MIRSVLLDGLPPHPVQMVCAHYYVQEECSYARDVSWEGQSGAATKKAPLCGLCEPNGYGGMICAAVELLGSICMYVVIDIYHMLPAGVSIGKG